MNLTRWLASRGFAVSCGLVALWAIFQNLYKLGTPLVISDEPTYARAGWRYVTGRFLPPADGSTVYSPLDNFQHPPLAKLLFGVAQRALVGSESITSDRLVAALCSLASAALLGFWIGRYAGRWTGLMAAGLASVLPEHVDDGAARYARFGVLDPVAELFMVASLALGWEWYRRRGKGGSAWWLAAATGAAVGLASAAKINGCLGIIGPVLMVLMTGHERMRARALQVLLAAVSSAATFGLSYLPFGAPADRIAYLIELQAQHRREGHLVGFAGQVSTAPPWWTNFWFAGRGIGWLVAAALLAGTLLALLQRHDRLVAWCGLALVGPVVFHIFVARIALPSYWTLWTPPLFALAAIGWTTALARLPAWRGRAGRIWSTLAIVALLAAPLAAAVGESARVARLRPTGTAVLPSLMQEHGLAGPIVYASIYPFELTTYVPGVARYRTVSPAALAADSVVVGQPRCRLVPDRGVLALVAVNLAAGRLREIHTDSAVVVYEVVRVLEPPSPAIVAEQPVSELADHC